jgi:hypothetical protein
MTRIATDEHSFNISCRMPGSARIALATHGTSAGSKEPVEQWRVGKRTKKKLGAYPSISLAQTREIFKRDFALTRHRGPSPSDRQCPSLINQAFKPSALQPHRKSAASCGRGKLRERRAQIERSVPRERSRLSPACRRTVSIASSPPCTDRKIAVDNLDSILCRQHQGSRLPVHVRAKPSVTN